MIFTIVCDTKLLFQYSLGLQFESVLDEMSWVGGLGGTKRAKTYSGIAEHLSKICFYNISDFEIDF